MLFVFFFFNDTATTEIYTLSLHDALPICRSRLRRALRRAAAQARHPEVRRGPALGEDPRRGVRAGRRHRGRSGPGQGTPRVPRALRLEGVIRRLPLLLAILLGLVMLAPRRVAAQGEPETPAADSIVVRGLRRVER